jgi:hypothetical protein
MPTTQLERGWMNTNALTILDLAGKKLLNTVLLDDVDLVDDTEESFPPLSATAKSCGPASHAPKANAAAPIKVLALTMRAHRRSYMNLRHRIQSVAFR